MTDLKNALGETARAGDDIAGGGAKYDAGKSEVFQGVFDYFPRALLEVANVSGYGAAKYSWGGQKSVKDGYNRYSNSLGRHLMLANIEGPHDLAGGSGLLHDAQVAWNALAKLEVGLRDGHYKSTRGNPLPPKAEAKPVDPVAVAAEGTNFQAFEAAFKEAQPKDLDVRLNPRGLAAPSDKEIAEVLGGMLSHILGEDVVVITGSARDVYAAIGQWPPGYQPDYLDRQWAADQDFFGGSQFDFGDGVGGLELTPKAKAALRAGRQQGKTGLTINKLKPAAQKAAAKKAPSRKRAVRAPARKR